MIKYVDLLLVNPGNRLEQFARLSDLATIAQPLGLAMIAAYVRQFGFSVAIIDAEVYGWIPEEVIKKISEYNPLVIGLSAFTTKMTAAGKILFLIKKYMPQVITIVGGHHPSAIPTRTLEEEAVDFVIKGEGFFPIVELLRCIKDRRNEFNIPGVWYREGDKIIGNGQASGLTNLDDLPMAAWDLLPMERYRAHHWQSWDHGLDMSGFAIIYTSLGCPFNCAYCSVNVVYQERRVRYRSPEKVVDEIRYLVEHYGVRYIEIIDDTFTLNYKRVELLCDKIIESGLGDKVSMWCFARTDRADKKLMEKMRQAGIRWVFMGFESGDDVVLQGVNKKQTIDDIRVAVQNVREAGIYIGGNYVFGLPNDTKETMETTLAFAKELNTEHANFFVMMAYPGTQFHNLSKEKKYPLPEEWGQYGFFASNAIPMRNDNLSSQEILVFRDKAFQEYFSSQRYQSMILAKFGEEVLEFLRTKILTKTIVRKVI